MARGRTLTPWVKRLDQDALATMPGSAKRSFTKVRGDSTVKIVSLTGGVVEGHGNNFGPDRAFGLIEQSEGDAIAFFMRAHDLRSLARRRDRDAVDGGDHGPCLDAGLGRRAFLGNDRDQRPSRGQKRCAQRCRFRHPREFDPRIAAWRRRTRHPPGDAQRAQDHHRKHSQPQTRHARF